MRWMNTPSYSITEVYNDLKGGEERVRWSNVVWSRIATPRSRFISWQAFNNSLKEKHRLKLVGVVDIETCPICGLESETVNHLFFQCVFSQKCVDKLKEWIGTNRKIETLEDTLRRSYLSRLKRNHYEAILCNFIYAIWSARNDATWNNTVPMVNQVVGNVKDASETRFKFLASLRREST